MKMVYLEQAKSGNHVKIKIWKALMPKPPKINSSKKDKKYLSCEITRLPHIADNNMNYITRVVDRYIERAPVH